MENFRVIEFHRQRDFSSKMNATSEFIKQNFGPLFKSLLFIAGPPVLAGSLLLSSFIRTLFGGMAGGGATNPNFINMFTSAGFWIQLVLFFLFVLVSGIVSIATINNYILLYGEKRTNKIEVSEVWERVRATFWMYFGTMLLFAFLSAVVYVVLLLPVVALGALSPALIFLGILFVIIALFYFLFGASLTFIIRAYEKKGFFESVLRSFSLVRGKWWSTFGLIFILYLIVMIISYIPLIPFYAIMFANMMHNTEAQGLPSSTSLPVWTTLFFTIYYLLQIVLSTLPNVGIAFQYFNLVERKESRGLLTEIETLGKPQETDRPEEHF